MFHGNSSHGTTSPQLNNVNGGAESNHNNGHHNPPPPSPGPPVVTSSSLLRRGGGGGSTGSAANPPRLHGSPHQQQQPPSAPMPPPPGGPSSGFPSSAPHHHHLHHHHHHQHHQHQHMQPPQQTGNNAAGNATNRGGQGGSSPYPQPASGSHLQQAAPPPRGTPTNAYGNGSFDMNGQQPQPSYGAQRQQQSQQVHHHHHHHHLHHHHHTSPSLGGAPYGSSMTSPQPQQQRSTPYPAAPSNPSRSGSNTPHTEGAPGGFGGGAPYHPPNNSGPNLYGGMGNAFPPSPHIGQQASAGGALGGSGSYQNNNWTGAGSGYDQPSSLGGSRNGGGGGYNNNNFNNSNNGSSPHQQNFGSQQPTAAGGSRGNYAPNQQQLQTGTNNRSPNHNANNNNTLPPSLHNNSSNGNNRGIHNGSSNNTANNNEYHNNSSADMLLSYGAGGGGPSSPSYVTSQQQQQQQGGGRAGWGAAAPPNPHHHHLHHHQHHHLHHASSHSGGMTGGDNAGYSQMSSPPPPGDTAAGYSSAPSGYNNNVNNGGRDGSTGGGSLNFHQGHHHHHHHQHHQHHHHQLQHTQSPDSYGNANAGDFISGNTNNNSGIAPPPPIRLPGHQNNNNMLPPHLAHQHNQWNDTNNSSAYPSTTGPTSRASAHNNNGGAPVSPLAQGAPSNWPNRNNNNIALPSQQPFGRGDGQQRVGGAQRNGPPTAGGNHLQQGSSNNNMLPPTVSVGNAHNNNGYASGNNNSNAPAPHHHHHHAFHQHNSSHHQTHMHSSGGNQFADPIGNGALQHNNNNGYYNNNTNNSNTSGAAPTSHHNTPAPQPSWVPPGGGVAAAGAGPLPPPQFLGGHLRHPPNLGLPSVRGANNANNEFEGHGGQHNFSPLQQPRYDNGTQGPTLPHALRQYQQSQQQQQQSMNRSNFGANSAGGVGVQSQSQAVVPPQEYGGFRPAHVGQHQHHQQQRSNSNNGIPQYPPPPSHQQHLHHRGTTASHHQQRGDSGVYNGNNNNSGQQQPQQPLHSQHHQQLPAVPPAFHAMHHHHHHHHQHMAAVMSNSAGMHVPQPHPIQHHHHHHHAAHLHAGKPMLEGSAMVDPYYAGMDDVNLSGVGGGRDYMPHVLPHQHVGGDAATGVSPAQEDRSAESQSTLSVDLYVFLRQKGLLEKHGLSELLPDDEDSDDVDEAHETSGSSNKQQQAVSGGKGGKGSAGSTKSASPQAAAAADDAADQANRGHHKIAVDGNYALLRLRDKMRQQDPLWFLHAPLPQLLLDLIKLDVLNLRDVGLEPIYVFNGLGASGDVEAFVTPSMTMQQRSDVWKMLDPQLSETAESPMLGRQDCGTLNEVFDVTFNEDVEMAVGRYLRSELGVSVVTAPFLNWAQMITMHHEGRVKLLFAPPEALMFAYDDTELIMDIETANPSAPVAVVRRRTVLERLFPNFVTTVGGGAAPPPPPLAASGDDTNAQLTAPSVVPTKDYTKAGDRFLDFCLLASTHPSIQSLRATIQMSVEDLYEELSSTTPKFRSIRELIEATSSPTQPAANTARAASDSVSKGSEWLKHAKGRCFMRHCVVMSLSPTIEKPLQYLSQALALPSRAKRLTAANIIRHQQQQQQLTAPPPQIPRTPQNIGGVFGNLVPDGLFFLQFCGLLSVGTMTCITQTYVCDEGPVCDSLDFREAMVVLISLRTQVTYQLVREIAEPKTVRVGGAGEAATITAHPQQQHAHHAHPRGGHGGDEHAQQQHHYLDRLKSISWIRWYRPILQAVPRPVEIIKLDDWKLPTPFQSAPVTPSAASATAGVVSPLLSRSATSNSAHNSTTALTTNSSAAASTTMTTTNAASTRLDAIIPLKSVLGLNNRAIPALARGSVTTGLYNTTQEVYCAVILKSLDLLGYFTHAVQTTVAGGGQDGNGAATTNGNSPSAPPPPGSPVDETTPGPSTVQSDLSPFSREVSYVVECDAEHQYQYVLLTELVRTQSLSVRPIQFVDEDEPSDGHATYGRSSTPIQQQFEAVPELLCRIACALPLRVDVAYPMFSDDDDTHHVTNPDSESTDGAAGDLTSAAASAGPSSGDTNAETASRKVLLPLYDKSITAFLQLARVTNRALRELVEVMTASMYLDGTAGCGLSELASLEQQLPFHNLPNPLAALVLRFIVRHLDRWESMAPQERLQYLGKHFPMFHNIEAIVHEVLLFLIHGLHLLSVFHAADQELVDADIRRCVPEAVALTVRVWRLFLASTNLPVCHLNLEHTDAPQ